RGAEPGRAAVPLAAAAGLMEHKSERDADADATEVECGTVGELAGVASGALVADSNRRCKADREVEGVLPANSRLRRPGRPAVVTVVRGGIEGTGVADLVGFEGPHPELDVGESPFVRCAEE